MIVLLTFVVNNHFMQPALTEIKQAIQPILKRHEIKRASLFGSFADGTANDSSDVDILVELSGTIGLLAFIRIKHDLEDVLNRKVDLVEFRAIKPSLQQLILNQSIPIYGQETT